MIAKDIIRYGVEHKIMPQAMYSLQLATAVQLMIAPYKTMSAFYKEAEGNYLAFVAPNAFDVTSHVVENETDRLLIIRVKMPEPKDTYQCRATYLCFSRVSGKSLYFTSEMNNKGRYLLCAWSRDGAHLNFGYAPDSFDDELQVVESLFEKVKADGYRKKLKSLCAG